MSVSAGILPSASAREPMGGPHETTQLQPSSGRGAVFIHKQKDHQPGGLEATAIHGCSQSPKQRNPRIRHQQTQHLLKASWIMTVPSSRVLTWPKEQAALGGLFFRIRAVIFTRAPPEWLNHPRRPHLLEPLNREPLRCHQVNGDCRRSAHTAVAEGKRRQGVTRVSGFYQRSPNSHILMEILQIFKCWPPKYPIHFHSSRQHLQVGFSPQAVRFRSWLYIFYLSICNN